MANSRSKEHKCPNCGGFLVYIPEEGVLKCEHCDSKIKVEEYANASKEDDLYAGGSDEAEGSKVEGFDFSALKDAVTDENAENLPVYECRSCAAQLIAPPTAATISCPYCGNHIVLTDQVSGKLRPDGMIPFRYSPDKIASAVQKFYKGKKLLPKGFFSSAKIGDVTGVYLPFWVFDGSLSGQMTYKGDKVSHSREGNYDITTTTHYMLYRDVSGRFQGLPVDAGRNADDALMDSLEPFDLREAKPFDMGYLAGYTAERFDEPKKSMTQRAKGRMRKTLASAALKKAGAGFTGVRPEGGSLKADITAKYMLFPVYMFSIKDGSQSYPFAFNGQTGKVVGKLPIDPTVSRNYFLIRFGIIFGVLFGWSLLKYFCGY